MARRLDAALELLDRQLIGSDGTLAGKADDLELTDPGGNLAQPRVTAILTGPAAPARRGCAGWSAGSRGQAMRLSELLGVEVVDERGHTVGKVHDVRLEQARPELQGLHSSWRVEGLIVGRRALGARFGFGRAGVRGPWLLQVVFCDLGHDGRYVAWDRIRSIRPGLIRVTGTAADLPRPEPLG